jgi:hypothetical protein
VSGNPRADVYLKKATIQTRDRGMVRDRELYVAEVMLPDPYRWAISQRSYPGTTAVGSCDVAGHGVTSEEALDDLERMLRVIRELGAKVV